MTTVLRFLFLIPLGFVFACLTAAFALLWPFFDPTGAASSDPVFWIDTGIAFAAQSAMIGSTALVPWALFMAITEVLGLRSLILHVAAGALGAFAFSRLAYAPDPPAASVQTALIVAGLVFALVYWIIAGHAAGRWRRRRGEAVPPPEPTAKDDRGEPPAGDGTRQAG